MMPAPESLANCDDYLKHLELPREQHASVCAAFTTGGDTTPQGGMASLHCALGAGTQAQDNPAYRSVLPRLCHSSLYASLLQRSKEIGTGACATANSDRQPSGAWLPTAPPPNRGSMVPHPWGILNPVKRWLKSGSRREHHWIERRSTSDTRQQWPASSAGNMQDDCVDAPDPLGKWQRQGNLRRMILLSLMLMQTALATYFMAQVLPYQGAKPLEMAILALFSLLFCWVSAGFWTAMAGFLVMMRGTDKFAISQHVDDAQALDPAARTAIVMPICNEDVGRVMAGLRATYESIGQTGELKHFDFFILSDSSESDICASELSGWAGLCSELNAYGRIFYRRRQRRVKRKSGNIDDFCRRWGNNYRYMIVLDADSIMSGSCVTKLVRMMEANPGAGIIQTAPCAVGRETFYARMQQFASRVYGPLFTAGLHYWQLGESHYWGHNAIIRVEPFMRHCALAPLPGRGSLAGEILSHDFVEAALMRRAGWAVWIAYDLEGSYEEVPPNLLDELKRDRRWCHGNLMNFRLFTARGMHAVHRAVFVTGVMAYLSAPLWFAFLVLSTALLAQHSLVEPEYFVEPYQLFPIWPQWQPEKAIALFSATATLLFLPKFLSVFLIFVRGATQFGGRLRVLASMLIELLVSMLLAPVRMLFHTYFVVSAFLGWAIRWKSPPRHDSQTGWGEALRKHGLHQLLGLAWGGLVLWLNPAFLPWLLPIAGALLLSAPVSVLTSRVTLGRLFRRHKLFLTPEECQEPPAVSAAYQYVETHTYQQGFKDAVVDPVVNALMCATSRPHTRLPIHTRKEREALLEKFKCTDPGQLEEAHKRLFLGDPLLLSQLHLAAWSSEQAGKIWRGPATSSAQQEIETRPVRLVPLPET